jgi:hypothetical protein
LPSVRIAKSFLSLILSDADIADRSSYVGILEIFICSTCRLFKGYRTFLTEGILFEKAEGIFLIAKTFLTGISNTNTWLV